MKKNRWFAVISAMVMALAVGECSDPSSGTGNSGVDNSKYQVGDFVLKNGTILSKDKTPEKDTVAAVIVCAAADGKPALGVGIVHNQMAWCTESAAGYEIDISALVGDETSGYMDGRDGWDKLKAACSDAESNPENYPAWNYCRNYGANTGLEGDLATGWYLPTVAELYTIYQNKTAVNESLSKAGGSTFGTYCCYWSCCQDPSHDYGARILDFNDGTKPIDSKASDTSVCSVRAFN